jgi:acylpyruvate hydrolase
MPAESQKVDWEAELTVVVGKRGRRIPLERAAEHIAGYTIMNDVSVRDFQMRTSQWLQGKTWERSTPLGPWLVTSDESPGPSREITCEVDGEQKQKADTADLVFDPVALVAYASIVHTLEPGDVIATGTPGGVGMPSGTFLSEGSVMVTRIAGLGECRNVCRREAG